MPPVITCSAALNPYVNKEGVETLIEKICFALDLQLDDPDFVSKAISDFDKYFQNLFKIYHSKYGGITSEIHQVFESASSSGGSSRNRNLNIC